MNGIVVEINNKDAVILSDEGLFAKVRNENYEIGQTVRIKGTKRIASKWIAGAATMAAALAVCTIGAFAYYTPTDYVSMDVNPSVEYTVNMFDRTLDVKAVNDDGEAILSGLNLKNMKLQDAMKETLDQIITDGYLTDDPDGGVVIATSNDDMDEAEQLASELKQEIQTYLDGKENVIAEVDAEAVAPDRVKEAKELGYTPGKLNLVEKLQASTSGAIVDEEEWQAEWLKKPVKEINKAIKENRKLEKDKAKETFDDDQGDVTSEGGIESDENDSLKPGNAHPSDKDNKGKVKQDGRQEQITDEDADQDADQIENEQESTDPEDQLTDDNQYNSGGHNKDKS